MRYVTFLCLAGLLAACRITPAPGKTPAAPPAGVPFYLGTYDDPGVHDPGIYRFTLGPDGRLVNEGRSGEARNPSFLAFSPDRQTLLAVEELNDEPGSVVSFGVAADTLLLHNRRPSGGVAPCHVTVSADNWVAVANYSSGTVEMLQLMEDGMLSQPTDVEDHHARGAATPHAHSSYFLQDGNQLLSADLGTDEIWHYRVDDASGELTEASPATTAMAAGAGPRHLGLHPNGRWIYAINELNSTVTQLEFDGRSLAVGETWSTLPAGFTGDSFCADIHISADGKYLYGSNRGHNSIAVFAIDAAGGLKLLETEPVAGDWPRNFALSPDERFLLVANQRSKNITTLRRSAETGLLDYVATAPAPVPVCILF